MKQNFEKLKQFIIKHDELFFFIIFFIIFLGIDLYIRTVPTDEMWNFQNIYKMYNGYKIYIDANVITTPLFHYIGMFIFKVFGANFFVFKLYGVFINSFLCFGVYKLFKKLNISKLFSLFLTIVILILGRNIYYNTTNYNNLALMFVIYGLIVILNRRKYSTNQFIILEAIISFLVILTKQNIGLLYLFSLIVYSFVYEKEKRLKNIIKIMGIEIILICIFILFLYEQGILEGFISYTMLGIKEFAKQNVLVGLNTMLLISIVIITAIFVVIINKKKIYDNTIRKDINSIAIFAFPLIIYAYPIFNVVHIEFALFCINILLIYIIYLIFNELIKRKWIFIIINCFLLSAVMISGIAIYKYVIKVDYGFNYNDVFFGTLIDEDKKEKISIITDYIKKSNQRVVVFSPEAVMYMLPLKLNNGNMDEPLLGNFGKAGEDGVIEEISKLKNTKILIKKDKEFFQESEKVLQYIKDNLKYIEEVEDFLVYQTED